MYLIIQEQKRAHKKTIFVETPDEISSEILSIVKKVTKNSSDEYLGYTSDINWELKKKRYIISLDEYFIPQKFIAINLRYVCPPKCQELKFKDKSVTVFPVTQALTEDEFKVMIDIWQAYKEDKKRTNKQEQDNIKRLEYLQVLEEPGFLNLLTIVDILT